jgi:hypothetical protein
MLFIRRRRLDDLGASAVLLAFRYSLDRSRLEIRRPKK